MLLRRLIAGAHDPSKGTAPSAADGVPCTLDDLVSAQPWLLVADVDTLLDELERCADGRVLSVLWLVGRGVGGTVTGGGGEEASAVRCLGHVCVWGGM